QAKMAKFDATLKTMGEAGVKARDHLLAAGNAATQLGFDNEEAAVSVAKLFQRTGDASQAIRLNAIAMDLARDRTLDRTTASTLVGLVLSGNSRVLKNYGIDIKDTATPMEALDELQRRLAGSAAAYADTLPGKLAVLREKWTNVTEQIGNALI